MYTYRIVNSLNRFRKGNSMKDSMLVGLFSGLLGAFIIELFNLILGKRLFFGKIASSMVTNPARSNRLKNMLYGEIMHLTVGAGIGSIISLVLQKTEKNFAIIKGTFISLVAWIVLHNGGNKLDLFSIKPRSTKNHYFSLIQHLIYGISTSALIKYMANPVTFKQASFAKNRNQLNTEPFIPSELEPTISENMIH